MNQNTIQKLESKVIKCDVCNIIITWDTAYEYCNAITCIKCDPQDSKNFIDDENPLLNFDDDE